jgi:flagellar protein FlbD
MVKLTKLSGEKIVVNSDHIRFVQSIPDTTLIFVDQQNLIVKESPEEVVELIASSRRQQVQFIKNEVSP